MHHNTYHVGGISDINVSDDFTAGRIIGATGISTFNVTVSNAFQI